MRLNDGPCRRGKKKATHLSHALQNLKHQCPRSDYNNLLRPQLRRLCPLGSPALRDVGACKGSQRRVRTSRRGLRAIRRRKRTERFAILYLEWLSADCMVGERASAMMERLPRARPKLHILPKTRKANTCNML